MSTGITITEYTDGMGIAIIEYTVDPAQAAEVNRRLREHVVAAAQRIAGYRGWLTADLGDNQRRDLWLFEAAAALRGMEAIGQAAAEHLVPLIGAPTQSLMGTILMSDGALTRIRDGGLAKP